MFNICYFSKIIKKSFVLFLTIFFALPVSAKHLHPEKYYQKQWCDKKGGVSEYKLKDGTRVDCLTDKYAVEFDFARKYHECLGQAQHYSARTGRQGACVLIIESFKDYKYVQSLRKTIRKKKLNVRSFIKEADELKALKDSLTDDIN